MKSDDWLHEECVADAIEALPPDVDGVRSLA